MYEFHVEKAERHMYEFHVEKTFRMPSPALSLNPKP
jgi:hypothetical protein